MSGHAPPLIPGDSVFTNIKLVQNATLVAKSVNGLDHPQLPTDATNKNYVDTLIAAIPALPAQAVQFNSDPAGQLVGSSDLLYDNSLRVLSLNGLLNMNSLFSSINFSQNQGQITGLINPVGPLDAANKQYVDSISSTPSAPTNSVQFNNSGAFGGSSNFVYDNSLKILSLDGDLDLTGTNSVISFPNTNGIVTGLANPVDPLDAANKQYVDSAVTLTPGLPFTSIQYNNGGLLGGSPNYTWNNGTNTLTLNGTFDNTETTDSTSQTTGSIITAGGVGIAKNVNIGGVCYATDFFSTSDERLKTDIERISESDLERINNIHGYSYKYTDDVYNSDDHELKYGFLAGELEKNGLNEFIKTVDQYKRISYQSFIPLLLEKIIRLENKVKMLEGGTSNVQIRPERMSRKTPPRRF